MSALRAEIDRECHMIALRRHAARSMGFCALQDVEAGSRQHEAIEYTRDPCPKCGVRGDLGCAHHKPVPLAGVTYQRYAARHKAPRR